MKSADIALLYGTVLFKEKAQSRSNDNEIREGIQLMNEMYKPKANLNSLLVNLTNYNDPAHRCAYLHKYSMCHTGLVCEVLRRILEENQFLRNYFANLLSTKSRCFKICSLGGGPGSEIVSILLMLHHYFGNFKCHTTVVDLSYLWSDTFELIVSELKQDNIYPNLSTLLENFDYIYLETNLFETMIPYVNESLGKADFVTMVKFISSLPEDNLIVMVRKIFNSVRPGALVLYIDNSGGGFHKTMIQAAKECRMESVFGPLRHFFYKNSNFDIRRYGYPSLSQTRVTIEMWQKLHQGQFAQRPKPIVGIQCIITKNKELWEEPCQEYIDTEIPKSTIAEMEIARLPTNSVIPPPGLPLCNTPTPNISVYNVSTTNILAQHTLNLHPSIIPSNNTRHPGTSYNLRPSGTSSHIICPTNVPVHNRQPAISANNYHSNRVSTRQERPIRPAFEEREEEPVCCTCIIL